MLGMRGTGLRALIYSGDCDLVIPHPGTELWTRSLGLRALRSRPWRLHHYVRTFRAAFITTSAHCGSFKRR